VIVQVESCDLGHKITRIRVCDSIDFSATTSFHSINSTAHIRVFRPGKKMSVAAAGAVSTLSTNLSTLCAYFFYLINKKA